MPLFHSTRGVPTLPRVTAAAAARDAGHVARLVREHGAVRVDGVLARGTCKRMLTHARLALLAALADVKGGRAAASERFAEHLLLGDQAGKRHDVKLRPDTPAVNAAMREALAALRGVYSACLGPDASLFELSAITSVAGTPAQAAHADFADWPTARDAHAEASADERAPVGSTDEHADVGPMVLVLFVALERLVEPMGPTRFLPRSHRRAYHAARAAAEAQAEASGAPRPTEPPDAYATPMLRAGDAVLMDAACFHCGGANTGRRMRTLLHLSYSRSRFEPTGFASFAQSLGADAAGARLGLDGGASAV